MHLTVFKYDSVGSSDLGAERRVTLAERHGLERLRRLVDDGVEPGKSYMVRVKVTIEGDRIIADFTGTDPQAKGPINAAVSQSMSGVLFAIRCLLSSDIPVNYGSFGAMEVIFPRELAEPRAQVGIAHRGADGRRAPRQRHVPLSHARRRRRNNTGGWRFSCVPSDPLCGGMHIDTAWEVLQLYADQVLPRLT